MERMIDDNVKQKLLASLAEEPPMVISTAYIYAKNYVTYGEDITKLWATAVQQQAILESARLLGWQDGYDSFKADYEKRLKADKISMLTELKKEIDAAPINPNGSESFKLGQATAFDRCESLIRRKINELEEESEAKDD